MIPTATWLSPLITAIVSLFVDIFVLLRAQRRPTTPRKPAAAPERRGRTGPPSGEPTRRQEKGQVSGRFP